MRIGIITLTQGNINNDHLYLTNVMDLFPKNAIGGSSAAEMAAQLLEVHSGIGAPVQTDIAEDKKIFRKRAWVGEFFRTHQLCAGDKMVIEKTDAFRYHVYPHRGT